MYLLEFMFFFSQISPRRGILDHIVVLLSILKNLHAALHSGYTKLHSHQQCWRVSFSPYSPYSRRRILMITVTGVRWNLIVDWTSSSLINIVDHLFMCLWPRVFLLYKNVCSDLCSIVIWFVWFFDIELYELQTNHIHFKPLLLSEPSFLHLNMLWHHPTWNFKWNKKNISKKFGFLLFLMVFLSYPL